MESDYCVAVTHFINPHLFWYKTIGAAAGELHVLSACEQNLAELYKNKPLCDHFLRPQVGDKVAVNFVAWNKFIRAEILQKAEFQQEEYIVWALDYGFPLLTKKEHLRNLPSNLQVDKGHIKVGGITNIFPAEQEYDDMEGNLVIKKKDKWLQKTCDVLEKLLADANSISFLKNFETNDNHSWGELIIVNHKGIEINAREYLLKTTNAIGEDETYFKESCFKLKTTKIAPWLTNDRNTKMKFNNIKHNYIEHSKQMNATIVDENAKRKVEDWQERNERRKIEGVSELFETSCDISEENIYDETFDDSVSVVNEHQQQLNYIGKAGMLTKIKQQKYMSAKDLPPPALPNSFEINPMMFDVNLPPEPESFCSLRSSFTHASSRLDKLEHLSVKLNSMREIEKKTHIISEHQNIQSQSYKPLIDLISSGSSTVSSVGLRQQKLNEMRKRAARAEKDKKTTDTTVCNPMQINNETNSSINQSTTSDSYSYKLLEQSTLSTLNNTIADNTQETKSEISVKNVRAKHLIAMRKKFGSSSIPSSSKEINTSSKSNSNQSKIQDDIDKQNILSFDDFDLKPKQISKPEVDIKQFNEVYSVATRASTTNQDALKIQQDDIHKQNILSFDDFILKSKQISKPEGDIKQFNEIYSVVTPASTTNQDVLKLSQFGYDDITVIPAGFDITRLHPYKDEENHWHRKKTTRYDCIPHNKSSSVDEILFNNANDQTFSSTDFFQLKLPKKSSETLADNFNQIHSNEVCVNTNVFLDSEPQKSFQHQELEKKEQLLSDFSTSTNSTVPSQKLRKRRQLQSPSSQLSKIDRILREHSIEKENGNTNILDLKLLNTSSSSQKSLITVSTSSNASCSDGKLESVIASSSNRNGNSSPLSLFVDKTQNEEANKQILNDELLIDVKRTEQLPLVEGEHKIQTKFIDHLVLAHSGIQLTAIENISEAPLLPEIHEEMRQMRINKMYRIQVYSWSHVLRNNSLFVVNPSRSGKTWSYLPPLISLLCYQANSLKSSYGPAALILVASLKHVELITNYCRRLMSGFKNEAPTCVPSYGMRNLIETKIQLLNGCGILVATPSSVLRLLQANDDEPLFDAERLQHIVIDDLDIMLSRSPVDFENACRIIFKMSKKTQSKKLSAKLIVTSRDWDGIMVKLIRKSLQPLLLIGDFLEAAVYGQATLSVKLKSTGEKNNTILKFLTKISASTNGLDNRTLIMCNDDEDVSQLIKFLYDYGHHCLGYYSRSTEIEIVTINEWKKKLSTQVLICTDARFCELKVQNVNNLIHYSMPTSWTRFTTRFSALASIYNNYIGALTSVSTTCTPNKYAHSMILLDENNSLQLPRLVEFMRKHNQVVHNEILAVSKRVLIAREEQRIINGSLLCPQLLEFGECDEARCDNRHELTRFDAVHKKDDIPCSGEIRVHILKVFLPTHYAVRVLHHKLPNSKKWLEVRRSSEALTFSIQLNMHYGNDKNLSLHWPPHINDLCIYQYGDNFRRALILEAPAFQQNNTNVVQSNLKVALRLIDDGNVISSVKCSEIYVCDEKFKNFPPQAVNVRLMNIVPFDNERTWDSKTTKQVKKWIMEDIKSNYIIQASIDFSLANTIWAKNVVVMEKLTGIDAYCQVVNLKKSLVEKSFGVLYKGARKHVRDIAEEYGLLNNNNQFDVENCDSDVDYQSCKNESINLIKFSSNDESTNTTMESAETGLDPMKKSINNTILNESQNPAIDVDPTNIEVNWNVQNDNVKQSDECHVPLMTNNIPIEMDRKSECWYKLSLNEVVKVEIGDESENGNWENIFLQIIDKNSTFMFEELNQIIVKHVENIKSSNKKQKEIFEFEPLHNCIVKYDKLYLRAKIYGVFGEDPQQRLYRFFLCDYACFTNAKIEDLYNDFLYETTNEIVTFTPFQAIHCTLAGIKWDRFTKRYQVTKDYLYACAVLENYTDEKTNSNLHNLSINSYKILLYECENENEFKTALLFNKSLIDSGITVYDEETKNFLDYEIDFEMEQEEKTINVENDNVEEIVDVSNNEKVLTYEELIDFIKADAFDIKFNDMVEDIQKLEAKSESKTTTNNKPNKDCLNVSLCEKSFPDALESSDKKESTNLLSKEKSKLFSSDSELDEQGHCTSNTNSIKSSTSLSSSDASNGKLHLLRHSQPPPLKALHKRPETTWYENDCMIFVSIYAPDIKNYLLEVTPKTILFVAEIHFETCLLNLNLLGSIDPQSVSHEIKGLNVVIRLEKIIFEKWPRLLKESTKYSWLKYNFNAFDSIEKEYLLPQQLLHTMLDNEFNLKKKTNG